MRYTPKYKTADFLLRTLGYNEPCPRGYRKIMTERNLRRCKEGFLYNTMHAITCLNEINLHYDKAKTSTIHKSFYSHPLVDQEMQKIIDLDMSFKPKWYQKLFYHIRVFMSFILKPPRMAINKDKNTASLMK